MCDPQSAKDKQIEEVNLKKIWELMETSKLTAVQAMKVLSIPEPERQKYLDMI